MSRSEEWQWRMKHDPMFRRVECYRNYLQDFEYRYTDEDTRKMENKNGELVQPFQDENWDPNYAFKPRVLYL